MAEYIISTTNMPDHILEIVAPWCNAEIVRCRDCRYFKPYEARLVEGCKCTRVSTCFKVDDDGFCAWGEMP